MCILEAMDVSTAADTADLAFNAETALKGDAFGRGGIASVKLHKPLLLDLRS